MMSFLTLNSISDISSISENSFGQYRRLWTLAYLVMSLETTSITNEMLTDLHMKKQFAIDALDFESAQILYTEIQTCLGRRADEQIAQIRAEARRDLKRAQDAHRSRLEDLAEERRRTDARLYSKFQVLFEETQDDHIHQLMDLEKERGLTLLEESEREIPEQIALLELAKKEAIDSRFQNAIDLRTQAREVGEAELEARRKHVEEHFARAKEELLERQRVELDQITQLHEEESNQIRDNFEKSHRDESNFFDDAVALIRDRGEVKIQSLTASPKVKAEAIDNLNKALDESMAQFNSRPPVVAHLTQSEEMRLTTLCPTKAAKNEMPTELPETIIQQAQIKTVKTAATRTGLRPPSKSSTGLISRAYTANAGKR
jgi:hypothetical protein